MTFHIITLFPHIFDSYINESILKRARQKKIIAIHTHNIRDFTSHKNKTVDDTPYGGGAGMVLMAEPLLRTVHHVLKGKPLGKKTKIIVCSAKGEMFNQKMAYDLAKNTERIIFISGRYEGIDERVAEVLSVQEVSLGPYVLTDGDVASMVMISAISRLIPGVIRFESLQEESYWNTLLRSEHAQNESMNLEYPHYTRPEVLVWKRKKYRVPEVLLSGDHKKIAEWRKSKQKKSGA